MNWQSDHIDHDEHRAQQDHINQEQAAELAALEAEVPTTMRIIDENPADYRDAVRAAREVLAPHRTTRRPEGVSGTNFMTPDVIGHVLDSDGGAVEVSTGWFMGERVWGLTWGGDDRYTRSTCAHSLAEVLSLLGHA